MSRSQWRLSLIYFSGFRNGAAEAQDVKPVCCGEQIGTCRILNTSESVLPNDLMRLTPLTSRVPEESASWSASVFAHRLGSVFVVLWDHSCTSVTSTFARELDTKLAKRAIPIDD